ncbi:MAG: NUDIX hydrolase [Actinomycetota bacterium]|nr:NUDIX hydrolase [Actinomycetota bacterium]
MPDATGADAAARAALSTGPLADLPDPAPVTGSELAFDGKVWDVRRDTFTFGGHSVVREYVDHTGAVAVLAMDSDGRVLLINQYRHPIGEREWELPAGLLDIPGEPPLLAAQRELAEEVDLAASDWTELLTFHTSPGGSNEVLHVFAAEGLSATPTFARTEEEAEIVVRWAPLQEVVDGVLAGRLRNSILIVAALTAHARHG